jgi:hypothetical protein
MEYQREVNKLLSLMSEDTQEILKLCDAYIAGGAITSVFCNREVNDVDVYFKSQEHLYIFLQMVFDGTFALVCTNYTNRSVMFRDKVTQQEVQAIVYKFFSTAEDIFNDFDYTINMGAYDFSTNSLVLHQDFMKHNSQRYLQFNPNTAYPLISALRVNKYIERGYNISKPQYLKIMFAIANLSFSSWEEVRDHVAGMYGLDLTQVFKDEDEFSIEKTIEILDGLEPDTKLYSFRENIDLDNLIKYLGLDADDTRIDCSNIQFKNVSLTEDGTLRSHFDNTFIYKVGETVNGGEKGIWFEKGYDIIDGQYRHEHDNVILQLEGEEPIPKEFWHTVTLKGDVKVVAMYTKVEFLRKFKRGD